MTEEAVIMKQNTSHLWTPHGKQEWDLTSRNLETVKAQNL